MLVKPFKTECLRQMRRRLFSTIILIIGFITVQAQSSQVLQNLPSSYKWYQLKTPHFNIIYPEGFRKQGQRMANTMEHIYDPAAASLGVRPKKKLSSHTAKPEFCIQWICNTRSS